MMTINDNDNDNDSGTLVIIIDPPCDMPPSIVVVVIVIAIVVIVTFVVTGIFYVCLPLLVILECLNADMLFRVSRFASIVVVNFYIACYYDIQLYDVL